MHQPPIGTVPALTLHPLTRLVLAMLVAGTLLLAVTAAQAQTPEQRCQAAKNKIAGRYAVCRQNAEAKFVTTGNADAYAQTILRCEYKFASMWEQLEAKATAAGAACLDAPLDQMSVAAVIDDCTDNVATALAGGGLIDCTADLATCADDLGTCTTDLTEAASNLVACNGTVTTLSGNLTTCNGSLGTCAIDLGTCNAALGTCPSDLATCQAAPQGQPLKTGQATCWDSSGAVIPCAGTGQDGELQTGLTRAYMDNADGTITDTRTGLMWEKLSDDGSIHDKDNTYTWTNAFAVKVAALHSGSGFAGHADWRVPNRFELESLVNLGTYNPAVSPAFNTACTAGCTVFTCSCTATSFNRLYWSSTTSTGGPTWAWRVDLNSGDINSDGKGSSFYVRAVRTAP